MAARTGSSANDLFISTLQQTDYDGSAGSDTVDYRNATAFVSADLSSGQGSFGDIYVSIENLRGSSFGDLLRGDAGANTLVGRAGTDTLSGGDGNDTLYADETGVLDVGADRDLIDGGAGDDVIWAGFNDYVEGSSGFDTLLLSYAGAPIEPSDFNSGYNIDTTNMIATQVGNFRNIEQVAYLWGSSFDDSIRLATQIGSITVEAGDGNDSVLAGNSAVTVYGEDGADNIDGGTAGDILFGGAGNDNLFGNLGSDRLDGGDGADVIATNVGLSFDNGSEQDQVDAGAGADIIFAGYGDIVDGGEGFDTVYISYIGGSSGIANGDTATLFAGRPLVAGGGTLANVESFSTLALTSFDDYMVFGNQQARVEAYSWDGDDTLIAQQADVIFHGGNGNDLLVGGLENDRLFGDAGDDRIVGGQGFDYFEGGLGNDRYIFVNVDGERDMVSFERGDIIDLTGIDAHATASGDQAFAFIGDANFSGAAGELRSAYERGPFGESTYVVSGDVDGDQVADFMIHVNVSQSLTAADFLL